MILANKHWFVCWLLDTHVIRVLHTQDVPLILPKDTYATCMFAYLLLHLVLLSLNFPKRCIRLRRCSVRLEQNAFSKTKPGAGWSLTVNKSYRLIRFFWIWMDVFYFSLLDSSWFVCLVCKQSKSKLTEALEERCGC